MKVSNDTFSVEIPLFLPSDTYRMCWVTNMGWPVGLDKNADKSVLFLKSVRTVICKWSDQICCVQKSPLCTDLSTWVTALKTYIGISTCAGDAAFRCGSTRNGKIKIHYLAVQTLVLSAPLHQMKTVTEVTDEYHHVLYCSHSRLHCATSLLQSIDWWEHVVLEIFDDRRGCAKFLMSCGTLVKLCGHLAPHHVRQHTLFRPFCDQE